MSRSPYRAALAAALAAATVLAAGANGPKFYSDDPLWRDPEVADASGAKETDISQQYDFLENTFLNAGDRANTRAVNVNTVDEVPDSSWFTNRAGREPLTIEQLVQGPDTGRGPAPGAWTIVSAKSEGITPGFTIRDASNTLYFIKFDPPSNPEMASGAEVISTKLFHAFGYHVPENYLAVLPAEALVIGEGATVTDVDGRKEPMQRRHIAELLAKAARSADGTYRVIASKGLPGTPLGHFRYYGTRPDDPNDIFPHEHRRELRGLSVFAAWLNHDDSRSVNSHDSLVREGSRAIIRHHLIDFGSTLGSGSTRAQTMRAGNEYLWEAGPTFKTMATLGLWVRPWLKVDYPDIPAVGRFEATYFRPDAWKPEYPNPAFRNARPDDRFWAANIVAAIPDAAVRAIVESARYSDPRATTYMVDVLLARKRKVLAAWLNGTNPVVKPSLSATGALAFENAAERAGVATAAESYAIQWSRFDNATSTHEPIGPEMTTRERGAQAPAALLAGSPAYVAATIRARHPDHPAWSQPLVVYFRRSGDGWTLVGLERGL